MDTPLGKKVVLVIEDDSPLRNALNDKLLQEGFLVFLAADGEEGLALSLREHPDLVLLDLLMPKMGGIEMAKRLRADAWGQHAKILILTNATDPGRVSEALDERVFDYLAKSDTSIDELVVRIRQIV